MKKVLIFLTLTVVLLLCLVACNGQTEHTHNFGEWSATKNATCIEDGIKTRYCDCGEKQSDTIPFVEHNYVDNVCKNCGDKKETESLPAYSIDLEYTLNRDGKSFSVTSIGTCTDTDIIIPAIYKGFPVTHIGNSAFNRYDHLTSVVIPDSVTSIGDNAFSGCSSLTSIAIPNSVISIGADAFSNCSKLQFNEYEHCKYFGSIDNPYFALIEVTPQKRSIYIIHNDTKTIANAAFEGCTSLTYVRIPDGVMFIGDYAFAYCGFTSVTIPDSVISIGDGAFTWCDSLTSVVIPEGVTSIGDDAFSWCTSLTYVRISDSVTSIGVDAFFNCSSLQNVYYTGGVEDWEAITIGLGNTYLTSATRHDNYVPGN